MEYDKCLKQIQFFLQNNPLIVLGAGASMDYGLPSMEEIAAEIESNQDKILDKNFSNFCSQINSLGLENALDAVSLEPRTLEKIKEIVWTYINNKDLDFWNQYDPSASFPLSLLIEKVLQPASNKATIVTTNYDRLAEYAVDHIKATAITGFEGSLIRKMEFPSNKVESKRTATRERQVEIWKVHGSLDWFCKGADTIISFPLTRSIPKNHTPLIIPPGRQKYEHTHNDPYRSIISRADDSFLHAGSYLCIGYGFNDIHIQPKLIEAVRKGRPIVVLARTVSKKCKELLIDSGESHFILIESASKGKTQVYGNGWTNVFDGEFWHLEEFLKAWLGE